MQAPGILLVISGPSAVGKGTICNTLLQQSDDLKYSVSATTRTPRPGESDGINYFFVTKEDFLQMRDNSELLEWAEVFGNFYGTPKQPVLEALHQGQDIVLEIDIQGAIQVKAAYPECVMVFILPPSGEDLKERMLGRGTETAESIRNRLLEASREMSHVYSYDYAVVNYPGEVDRAVEEIKAILVAERARVKRLAPWLQQNIAEVKA